MSRRRPLISHHSVPYSLTLNTMAPDPVFYFRTGAERFDISQVWRITARSTKQYLAHEFKDISAFLVIG